MNELERRAGKMMAEGPLRIVCRNRGDNRATHRYDVMFAGYGTSGVFKPRPIVGGAALEQFLAREVGVHREVLESAVRCLENDGEVEIEHTQLSEIQIAALGL